MSEYLKKQAVLEWLDDRRYKSPWVESFRERLESGAFDIELVGIEDYYALQDKHRQALKKIRRLRSMLTTPSGTNLREMLLTIKQETQPIGGHPDPGALEDCWNEVFETISAIESKHTDNTEIQRLRAAFSSRGVFNALRYYQKQGLCEGNEYEEIENALEALSTTSEPTVGVGIDAPEGDQP